MNMQAAPVLDPPAPKSLAETGLSLVLMRDILLKTMFRRNLEEVTLLSKVMCLPVPVTQELVDLARRGKEAVAGRAYRASDLPVITSMAIAAGYTAVLILAFYISSSEVQELYTRIKVLWLACPVLLFWISRVIMLTHRGQMTDDPIVFAARDIVSWICMILVLTIAIFAQS